MFSSRIVPPSAMLFGTQAIILDFLTPGYGLTRGAMARSERGRITPKRRESFA
jgi:hypothetical protein